MPARPVRVRLTEITMRVVEFEESSPDVHHTLTGYDAWRRLAAASVAYGGDAGRVIDAARKGGVR